MQGKRSIICLFPLWKVSLLYSSWMTPPTNSSLKKSSFPRTRASTGNQIDSLSICIELALAFV